VKKTAWFAGMTFVPVVHDQRIMTSSVFCDRFLVFFSIPRVVAFVVGVSGRMNSTGNKFGNKIWGQFSSPTRSRSVRSTGLPFVNFPAGATVRRTTVWFRPAIP
jgi:hypothetical protein